MAVKHVDHRLKHSNYFLIALNVTSHKHLPCTATAVTSSAFAASFISLFKRLTNPRPPLTNYRHTCPLSFATSHWLAHATIPNLMPNKIRALLSPTFCNVCVLALVLYYLLRVRVRVASDKFLNVSLLSEISFCVCECLFTYLFSLCIYELCYKRIARTYVEIQGGAVSIVGLCDYHHINFTVTTILLLNFCSFLIYCLKQSNKNL